MFSLLPTPSLRWRHILVNAKSLASNTKGTSYVGGYQGELELFHDIFDFSNFGYDSLQELKDAPNNGEDIFNVTVHTDGFGVSVHFVKRKIKEDERKIDLVIEDFNKNEMKTLFLSVAVDPSRAKVFTATILHSKDKKEFRACSSKERQSFAGTVRRKKNVEKLKVTAGIKTMESEIPTAKTIIVDRMMEHIRYILANLKRLLRFYNFQSAAFRFYDYKGPMLKWQIYF